MSPRASRLLLAATALIAVGALAAVAIPGAVSDKPVPTSAEHPSLAIAPCCAAEQDAAHEGASTGTLTSIDVAADAAPAGAQESEPEPEDAAGDDGAAAEAEGETKDGEAREGKDDGEKAEKVAIDPELGILEGRIVLEGDPPELSSKIEVPANHQDHAFCSKHVKDERLILGKDKGVQNVVVSVEDYRPRTRPAPKEVRLDNKHCLFVPHIVTATAGSTLEITNSDSFIHNTRGVLLAGLRRLNSAIPPKGSPLEVRLRSAGWGVVKCDFHPWMQAHVHVFPHELYTLSEKDGTFRIVNIPPGTHKIRLWHEVLQNETVEVTIEKGKTTRLDEGLEAYGK